MATNYEQPQPVSPEQIASLVKDTSVANALKELLGDAPAAAQSVTGPVSRDTLSSLKEAPPEVIVFDSADGRINLASLGAEARGEIKALIFEGDTSVALTGLKGFSGVISLADGDNTVKAAGNNQSMTVATGAGNDSVATGRGADSISIGGGADTVSTGAGSDNIAFTGAVQGGKVVTGSGDDAIELGAGFSSTGAAVTINGGSGRGDSLDMSALDVASVSRRGNTVTITLEDGSQVLARGIEEFIYTDAQGQIVEIVGGARGLDAEFNG